MIYCGASDVDARYLVRRWEIGHAGLAALEGHGADTLEAARAMVPAGMVRLGPMPGDDPAIVEVWV